MPRLRWARALLAIAVADQLFLIMGLPLLDLNSQEQLSFLNLAALVAISLGCAIAMRKFGREAVATLAAGSLYATVLLVRNVYWLNVALRASHNGFDPSVKVSYLLAFLAFVPLPIALLIAWPLRGHESSESRG